MIDGFSIAGYRSIGETEVKVSDLSRLNVFIGKNNCGKSNILRFLKLMAESLPSRRGGSQPKLDAHLDFCLRSSNKTIRFGMQIKQGGFTASRYTAIADKIGRVQSSFADRLNGGYWVRFVVAPGQRVADDTADLTRFVQTHFNERETNLLTNALCNYTQGQAEQRCSDIAKLLHGEVIDIPTVTMVGAFRRISDQGEDVPSGEGLIGALRRLQNPGFQNYEADRRKFDRIVGFLRSVISTPNARLEIPAENDDIYVVIDEKTLPLASLGTGIHEIVILAAAVTLRDNEVVCLEEPEIHCHPELQKTFARYLIEQTSNQYLITSHSSAFADAPKSNTYSCWLDEDGYTRCELVATADDKLTMLLDLGYRPSDLLQANFVVWVEGPSDRLYLNTWLKAKAPDLIEGLRYAVMFYGGRLLSHLSYDTAEDDDIVRDFVRLARLNRSACIIIDSDRRNAADDLNETKRRIIDEFNKHNCHCWITAGRTIENYIGEDILNEAIANVHPQRKKALTWKRFADLTKVAGGKTMDKVAVARYVSKRPPDFTQLDLADSVDRLIECIRAHNH